MLKVGHVMGWAMRKKAFIYLDDQHGGFKMGSEIGDIKGIHENRDPSGKSRFKAKHVSWR